MTHQMLNHLTLVIWGSLVSQDEWMSDHVHKVLHQTHFANGYVGDEAASLSAFLALTQWRLQRVPSTKESKEAKNVQCNVSCSTRTGPLFEVLFDTGATHSFTNEIGDFITKLHLETMTVGDFLGVDAPVVGSGTVQWHVTNHGGNLQNITTQAYYVPSGQRHLFCPQRHFQD
jgi:hypothetical protein